MSYLKNAIYIRNTVTNFILSYFLPMFGIKYFNNVSVVVKGGTVTFCFTSFVTLIRSEVRVEGITDNFAYYSQVGKSIRHFNSFRLLGFNSVEF